MKIITVRHGKTKNNDLSLTQGWLDNKLSVLSNLGMTQAKKVAERLRNEKIDVISSSDLKRAHETAKEIAKYHDCEIILDERIREQKKGKYEGRPGDEGWNDFMASGKSVEDWTPEGGESMGEVKKKVFNFLEEIENIYKNKTVLIVSHGGPLAMISRHFRNEWAPFTKDDESAKYHSHKNTSVSEYSWDGEKWNVDTINCVEHLE